MIRVLLVEDELLVRTNIKLMLHNYSDCICICGEASNGEEALPFIDSLKPNIILSDMIMPKMNGLELCEIVNKKYPDIHFVALSNYDDFNFVRGTLKNGGVDYLLKHQLNAETLYQVLSNLSPKDNNASKTISYNENSINALRKKFILDLFGNMFYSREEILYHIKTLYIPLDMIQVRPVIMRIDNYSQILHSQDEKKKRIIEFSITNIGNEILNQYSTGILTHLDNEFYSILLSFASIRSELKIKEITDSIIHQISSNLKTYLNISTSYSIGKLCSKIEDVYDSYAKAFQNLNLTFYTGTGSILDEIYSFKNEPLEGLDKEQEKQIISTIILTDYNQLKRILSVIFQDITDKPLRLKNARMIFSDLISIITRVCKEKNIPLDFVFKTNISPTELLSQRITIDQVYPWFDKVFQELFSQLTSQSIGDSTYVRNAIAYINTNYAKPISLQSAADEIGISHGYLSKIFKEETKQGFSDYLNSLRISIASKMINYGETDLHKISDACGFQDYTYFFKVFKKKTGMTPSEYKKNKPL